MPSGGCLCGAVRLTIDAAPILSRLCWCRTCQRLAAGNASHSLFYPAVAVATDGPIAWYSRAAESGATIEHGFCPSCGTQLIARAPERPEVLVVRAGVLDDASDVPPPTVTIWTSQAPDWAHVDPGVQSHEAQPPHPLFRLQRL